MKVDYTGIAGTYDDHRFYAAKEIKKLVEFAGIRDGMRLLDLGCGTGNVSVQLQAMKDLDIVGADSSRPMLEIAGRKSLDVICAAAGRDFLPFNDNTFDMVIIAYVIHQIDDLAAVFSECHRVLSKGRLVLITSSHRQIETEHPVLGNLFPSAVKIDKARFPDIPVIEQHLAGAGFTNVQRQTLRIEKVPLDDEYLQKVKGKYVSTYHLIPQDEFEQGVAKLEAFIRNSPRTEYTEWQGTLLRADKDA
jgi:ubiquinone/menaquinone biosynthesis C-methylase UbiE